MSPSRADDEKLLLAIQMREEGATYAEIAKMMGRTTNSVIGMINRVYMAESGAHRKPRPSAKDQRLRKANSPAPRAVTLPPVPPLGPLGDEP